MNEIEVPFDRYWVRDIHAGNKMATTRATRLGDIGDMFTCEGVKFRITGVVRGSYYRMIAYNAPALEGLRDEGEYRDMLIRYYPGGMSSIFWLHIFEKVPIAVKSDPDEQLVKAQEEASGPPQSYDARHPTVGTRVSPETLACLDEIAKIRGISRADLVGEAIEMMITRAR